MTAPEEKERLRCPGSSYLITREVCRGRRLRGFSFCRRCPENTDQLSLFPTPLQVTEKDPRA